MASSTSRWHASPYLLLSLTSLFWSLNWVIGRAIVGHVSPLALASIRWMVAVAVMMPFAWPLIRAYAFPGRDRAKRLGAIRGFQLNGKQYLLQDVPLGSGR